tara:strand:- start:386 stop:550 length:165 start_codon:yes stop_codon:yes gene_type:complete
MNVAHKILAALEERQKDLNNLGNTLRTVNRADENLTSISIALDIILTEQENETD